MPEPAQGVNPQGAAAAPAAQGAAALPANGAGADGGQSQAIPYARFKEVNDQLAAFKKLGFEPNELTEALSVLATLIQQQESAPQAGAASAQSAPQPNGNGQWNPAEFEKWLTQQIPWLSQVKSFYENSQREKQSSTESLISRSRNELKKLATKAGYPEEQLEELENAISGLLHGNPELANRWRFGDLSVVAEAFESHQEKFVKPAATRYAQQMSAAKNRNRQELAPRVDGGAAAGGTPPPPKPKSIAEARTSALQRLADAGDLPEEPDSGPVE